MNKTFKDYLKGSLNPKIAIDKIMYDIRFAEEHPTFFKPCGFINFSGEQGGGKTSTAVMYIHNLVKEYPNVKIVSNCKLNFPDWNGEVIRYEGYEQIQTMDNGYEGIILFLDEIHAQFNSLESRKIDPSWFQIISQQRKRCLHVVGTSQVFNRIAKCWREQFTACISCSEIFDILQICSIVCQDDVEENGNGDVISYQTRDRRIWFRDPAVYDWYDTWERVEKVDEKKFKEDKGKETLKNDNSGL